MKKKHKKTLKLTKLELLELENAHLQQALYDIELERVNLQKQLAQKDKILMGYQVRDLENGFILLNDSESTIKKKRLDEKAKYVKMIDRVQKRLGLKGKFGYDPDSGEVIENNE